ncbi:hypothetical protein ACJRO7_005956 [Eucalyptus globulus]|uniref:Uncharacterized protein n=1 Tax=Eucalyptus globulus TaxID=34317 RepID=A0ABD3J0U0_EUCGL
MDKAMRGTLIFLCSLFVLQFVLAERLTVADDRHPEQKPRSIIHQIMSSALSFNREKLAALACQAHAYFFPPNLEGGSGDFEKGGGEAKEVGEKVGEAVTKSLEKGKSAVEDSARYAAEMADASARKAAEKVKKTLSEL